MAHALGRELDVSPWDALLGTLRRAAAKSHWYHERLGEVESDEVNELLPGGRLHPLVVEAQRADDFQAKIATLAIKAGIAEKLVMAAQVQATELFALMMRALEAGQLSDDQMGLIRGRLRLELLALEPSDEMRERMET